MSSQEHLYSAKPISTRLSWPQPKSKYETSLQLLCPIHACWVTLQGQFSSEGMREEHETRRRRRAIAEQLEAYTFLSPSVEYSVKLFEREPQLQLDSKQWVLNFTKSLTISRLVLVPKTLVTLDLAAFNTQYWGTVHLMSKFIMCIDKTIPLHYWAPPPTTSFPIQISIFPPNRQRKPRNKLTPSTWDTTIHITSPQTSRYPKGILTARILRIPK